MATQKKMTCKCQRKHLLLPCGTVFCGCGRRISFAGGQASVEETRKTLAKFRKARR